MTLMAIQKKETADFADSRGCKSSALLSYPRVSVSSAVRWKWCVVSFAALAWVAAAFGTRFTSADDKPVEVAVTVDKEKKSVTIACKIAPRKLPNLTEVYPIEVIATLPSPEGKKAHETVVTFSAKPSEIHAALVGLGLKPGKPALGEDTAAAGPEVKISLEVPGPDGKPRLLPIEKTLVDRKTGKPLPALKWIFTGSVMKEAPGKTEKIYAADTTGTLIAIFPVTDETVIQTNLTMKEEPLLKLETNTKLLPAEDLPAKLVIEVK
jgi:hypothetical protein